MKPLTLCIPFALVSVLAGCATTPYDSACQELAAKNRTQLASMIKSAQASAVERHVVLLETGTEIASRCRTHHIDRETFVDLPDSMWVWCQAQSQGNATFCLLYQVDDQVVRQRIY